jgi:hypothetical protein
MPPCLLLLAQVVQDQTAVIQLLQPLPRPVVVEVETLAPQVKLAARAVVAQLNLVILQLEMVRLIKVTLAAQE